MPSQLPASGAPIVTIFGGSGFIGRYVTQRMAREGWRVRVAVRRPNEAGFVRPYGSVGQVEPIQANIRDEASTRRAIAGSHAVVNCVGLLGETGKQTFRAVMKDGAARIARIAAEENVGRLVHISAIGADAQSDSLYARAKAAGEEAILAAFPSAVILRPSIVFGDGDGFFCKFASIARLSPVLPIIGPDTKFQPVYVDDVAAAVVAAVTGEASGTYELGGPEIRTFRELMEEMLRVVRRKRRIVALPLGLARFQAGFLDLVQGLSFDQITNTVVTSDQIKLLGQDNVVGPGAKGFADLGITPTAMEAVLESYLYAFRPHGQYEAIQESAGRLLNQ